MLLRYLLQYLGWLTKSLKVIKLSRWSMKKFVNSLARIEHASFFVGKADNGPGEMDFFKREKIVGEENFHSSCGVTNMNEAFVLSLFLWADLATLGVEKMRVNLV